MKILFELAKKYRKVAAIIGGVSSLLYFLYNAHERSHDQLIEAFKEHCAAEKKELQIQYDQITTDLEKCEAKFGSIDRGIDTKPYIDIRSLFVSSEEQKAPTDTTYFPDGFYSIKLMPGLKYSDTTYESFLEKQGQKSPPVFYNDLLRLAKLHLWEGEGSFHIKEGKFDYHVTPYVSLSKIKLKKLQISLSRIGAFLVQQGNQTYSGTQVPTEPDKERLEDLLEKDNKHLLETLDQVFAKGVVGPFSAYIEFSSFVGSLLSPNKSWEIIKLQKLGNVLYGRYLITLHNAEVNGALQERFFIRDENFLVSSHNYLYFIEILSPGFEPEDRSEFQSKVSSWLRQLRLILD